VSLVALPFVVIAATSSLLQRWYAATRPTGEADPYRVPRVVEDDTEA